MGLFDLLKNFDPDAIVKGIDDLEQAIDKALGGVSDVAEKVENAAGIVEKNVSQGSTGDPAAGTTIQVTEPDDE